MIKRTLLFTATFSITFSVAQLGMVRAEDNILSDAETREGYTLLFDGTLAGFRSNWVRYVQGDSANTDLDTAWTLDADCRCIRLRSGATDDIRSVKTYKDFELRFSYRSDNNQGVFYRSTLKYDHIWKSGVEYCINNISSVGKDNTGAASDLFAPDPIAYNLFGSGLWNEARIIVIGDSVEHWSSGIKVVGYKYHSPRFWEAYNVSKWAERYDTSLTNVVAGREDTGTGYLTEGYLGIQGDHGGRWQIKNLKITERPCFGGIKEDGSVCASTSSIGPGIESNRADFRILHRGPENLTLVFSQEVLESAEIVGLDGKVLCEASLSERGRKAVFSGALKTGLYILKFNLTSGTVTRRLNLF